MVQSADLGNFHDPAYLRRLIGPTDRGIFVQRQVSEGQVALTER